MILDLLSPEDYATHLVTQGVTIARYAQVTKTSGKTVPTTNTDLVVTAPVGRDVVRYRQCIWRGPAIAAQGETEAINKRADEVLDKLRKAGLDVRPGLWSQEGTP